MVQQQKGVHHGDYFLDYLWVDRGRNRQTHLAGRRSGGFIVTILLGIAGALIGGFIGTALGFGDITGFNFASFLIAIAGAIVLLLIYRMMKR